MLGTTGKKTLIAEMRRRGDQALEDSTAMLKIQWFVTFHTQLFISQSCSGQTYSRG